MRSLISTAPESVRDEVRHLKAGPMLERAAGYRPGTKRDLVSLAKFTLRLLARRAVALDADVAELDAIIAPLVAVTAPALLACTGLGTDTASALLVAARDDSERLRSEATFAHLCDMSPSTPAAARTSGTGSTEAVTAKPTPRCDESSSRGWSATRAPATTSRPHEGAARTGDLALLRHMHR